MIHRGVVKPLCIHYNTNITADTSFAGWQLAVKEENVY